MKIRVRTRREVDASLLIARLYDMGVNFEDIYGRYFEFDVLAERRGGQPLLTRKEERLVNKKIRKEGKVF